MSAAPLILNQLYRSYGKRLLDFIFALVALCFVSPALGVIALLVRVDSPGPVLFIQNRLGMRGGIFKTYKFRTMTHRLRVPDHEILGWDPDLTGIGCWLRRFKLDELPQLFNVLKGEMSIVGPRPALSAQLSEYDEVGRMRLLVRPGMTGLAQVNGNIHLAWSERWYYDAFYVDNLSFTLDLRIIFRSISVIVFGEEKFLKPLQPNSFKSRG
jgi:undecaprenyl phosphate N,N'-diacetylbacillosamine 1-phosphate transferase